MTLRACLIAAALLVAQPVPAAGAPRKGPLSYTSFVLPNGLKVLVHEDHTVPIVGVEVYYHVGSKDEVPGKTGFAHLFEHLMFKGSRNLADGEHFKYINEAGGTCNATTSRDRTNYFEIVPSSFLERALFLEADRMAHLLDGVTQATLDNQRDVVRNERRQNYENKPYGRARRPLVEALYPPEHPYHWMTIGLHEDLERASLDDVRTFFLKHYRPGNATLVIAGDVELADARALVAKHFGKIPSDPALPEQAPSTARTRRPDPLPIVKLAGEKRIELRDQVSLERVSLTWPSPAGFQPGDAARDLLATILGPSSGRLHQRLVHELQIAQHVAVAQESELLAGSFEISVLITPGHHADEIVAVIDDELGKIQSGKARIQEVELQKAKARWESELFFGLMAAGGLSGRTHRLASYDYYTSDPGYLERDLVRYRSVTVKEAEDAIRSLDRNRVRVVVLPAAQADAEGAR